MIVLTFLVLLISYQQIDTKITVTTNQNHMIENQTKILKTLNDTNILLTKILLKMK